MARIQNPLHYPRHLLEEQVRRAVLTNSGQVYRVADLTRVIDALVHHEDDRPVNPEGVRRALESLVADDIVSKRAYEPGRDAHVIMGTAVRRIWLYSMTSPVPTYTQAMVDHVSSLPAPRPLPAINPAYPDKDHQVNGRAINDYSGKLSLIMTLLENLQQDIDDDVSHLRKTVDAQARELNELRTLRQRLQGMIQ